jgi:beta-1,2-mannobiose phosphorylase / 1,2-beta-oligomannan phosphorylase
MLRHILLASLLAILLTTPSVAADPLTNSSFRPDEVEWVTRPGGPLFTGTSLRETFVPGVDGQPGAVVSAFDRLAPGRVAWDNRLRERGWIDRDGDLWRMWYTGYDGTKTGIRRLGLALSTDGYSWTRAESQPLLPELWVEDVCVLRREGFFEMVAEGAGDRAQRLLSRDGRRWDLLGTLDVRRVDGRPIEDGPFGTPVLWYEGPVAHLFYERRDLGIWLARSNDGKVWTNVSDTPVIFPGPGEYDRLALAMNQIVKLGDTYFAVMHGTGSESAPRLWNTYFARSQDLIHWEKPTRAVFEQSANRSSGQLVHDGRDWRLYTFHGHVEVHHAR